MSKEGLSIVNVAHNQRGEVVDVSFFLVESF